jgi:aspartate racemase
MEIDPQLVDAAAWLGKAADFLVIPCNSAHVGLPAIVQAAGCPVLSMIEVTLDEVARCGATRVGVLGFGGPSPLYLEPLGRRGIACETIDASVQASIDAAVRAVMEGRNGQAEADVALGAVSRLRARGTNGIVLGCTEIPLMLGRDREAADLIDPGAVLAEAAVRFALS